jgi:hypothetical protein
MSKRECVCGREFAGFCYHDEQGLLFAIGYIAVLSFLMWWCR